MGGIRAGSLSRRHSVSALFCPAQRSDVSAVRLDLLLLACDRSLVILTLDGKHMWHEHYCYGKVKTGRRIRYILYGVDPKTQAIAVIDLQRSRH